MTPLRPHHALILVPVAGILVGVPLLNRLNAFVWGVPLLLVWIVGCVLATSAALAVAAARDGTGEDDA